MLFRLLGYTMSVPMCPGMTVLSCTEFQTVLYLAKLLIQCDSL
jgi:hypothetical protein